jgi:serine protease AprX
MYNAVFDIQHAPLQNFHIDFRPEVSGPASVNATTFTVDPGINVLDVFATVEEGTGNLLGMRITSPSGVNYSTGIEYRVVGTNKREIVIQNPEPGTWTLEIRGARGLAAAQNVSSPVEIAPHGPVDGTITQTRFIFPVIPDIQGHPQQAAIEAALKSRLIDTFADGTFRPDAMVTREDLARSLALNPRLRQTLDTSFDPAGLVNRLDLVVALVKALGHDAEARALANTTVTSNGTPLSDNAEIPGSLRGYVQIAIDKGLFEVAIPGPRFEPATTVSRAALAGKLNAYRTLFTKAANGFSPPTTTSAR